MRPSTNLGVLRQVAARRLDRFRSQADSACRRLDKTARIEIGFITIELLNLWAKFCRSYYLSCTVRPRREKGGGVAATAFGGTTFDDAIGVAMKLHKNWK